MYNLNQYTATNSSPPLIFLSQPPLPKSQIPSSFACPRTVSSSTCLLPVCTPNGKEPAAPRVFFPIRRVVYAQRASLHEHIANLSRLPVSLPLPSYHFTVCFYLNKQTPNTRHDPLRLRFRKHQRTSFAGSPVYYSISHFLFHVKTDWIGQSSKQASRINAVSMSAIDVVPSDYIHSPQTAEKQKQRYRSSPLPGLAPTPCCVKTESLFCPMIPRVCVD